LEDCAPGCHAAVDVRYASGGSSDGPRQRRRDGPAHRRADCRLDFLPARTECPDDTASPNWRLIARRPRPVSLSAKTSSARLCNVFGRPSLTPRARAAARPEFTLSLIRLRSNSQTAFRTSSWNFPRGLLPLVSMPCELHTSGTETSTLGAARLHLGAQEFAFDATLRKGGRETKHPTARSRRTKSDAATSTTKHQRALVSEPMRDRIRACPRACWSTGKRRSCWSSMGLSRSELGGAVPAR
jgi:hypothetical protein